MNVYIIPRSIEKTTAGGTMYVEYIIPAAIIIIAAIYYVWTEYISL
jgi:hypothetical protein